MKRTLILCFLLILMLTHPGCVSEGAKYGLLLWYSSVVPALFPFMVLSSLIVSSGGLSRIMRPFFWILNPVFGLSEEGCYTLISGLLCGCPMGAKTCAEFLRQGRLNIREARFLLAVSNHASPMFVLGFLYPMLPGSCSPLRLLAAFYAPVPVLMLLAGLIYRPRTGFAERTRQQHPGFAERSSRPHPGFAEQTRQQHFDSAGQLCQTHSRFSAAESLVTACAGEEAGAPNANPEGSLSADAAILSAAGILIKIGGYLMLYSIAIEFLSGLDFIPSPVRLAAAAALEMTTGIRRTMASLPFPYSGAAACAVLAFGGFSGLSQTNAVIRGEESDIRPLSAQKNAGLSIRHYFFWKLLHAALSGALFLAL